MLAVILQSMTYVGMPRFVCVMALLQRILEELTRLDEITQTQLALPV
jgi:adenylate kinase family enzyme